MCKTRWMCETKETNDKYVKWKRLTHEVNKIMKWNNEINEFCDWKWSDDRWISSCNDVSQNVNLRLHTKCCKIRV